MYKEYTRPLEQSIDADKNVFSVLEEHVRRARRTILWSNIRTRQGSGRPSTRPNSKPRS